MGDRPDALGELIELALESRQTLPDVAHGLFVLNIASLTVLVDSKVIERTQIVSRLQEFLDAMPEERRNGLAGLLLRSAIDVFRPDSPRPDPRRLYEAIDGGLSPQGQAQWPRRSDP